MINVNCWSNKLSEQGSLFFSNDKTEERRGFSFSSDNGFITFNYLERLLEFRNNQHSRSSILMVKQMPFMKLNINCKTHIKNNKRSGVIVLHEDTDSTLHKNGIKTEDVITKIDGIPINDINDLSYFTRSSIFFKEGTEFEILRNGQLLNIKINII